MGPLGPGAHSVCRTQQHRCVQDAGIHALGWTRLTQPRMGWLEPTAAEQSVHHPRASSGCLDLVGLGTVA